MEVGSRQSEAELRAAQEGLDPESEAAAESPFIDIDTGHPAFPGLKGQEKRTESIPERQLRGVPTIGISAIYDNWPRLLQTENLGHYSSGS